MYIIDIVIKCHKPLSGFLLGWMGIIILGGLISCQTKSTLQKSDSEIRLLSAEKNYWTAGHRSGGRGVEFTLQVLNTGKELPKWESLETGGRMLSIQQSSDASTDTLILTATWLSSTDEKYATEGIPNFHNGILRYQYPSMGSKYLKIDTFNLIQTPPRP
ncbi:MAG: hypothetical protein EBS07_04410 [Sphingobacteriia bacterium]|nr:hypothetical protein [Sphingobacteriia bacterium]